MARLAYIIRKRLIDMLRKKTREDHNQSKRTHREICEVDNGNRCGETKVPVIDPSGITLPDDAIWKNVKSMLTENQWKWVQFYIIEGMPLQEIAKQEGVSIDAVKSWRRQARKKLKHE